MEDSTGFEPADSGFASHGVRPLHHESMLVCVVGFEPTAIRSRSGYSDLTELHTDVGESSGNRTHGRQGLKDPLVPINLRPIWQTCRESNPHGTFWRRSRFLSTSLCWWTPRDSNPHSPACKASRFPLDRKAHMVLTERFELSLYRV